MAPMWSTKDSKADGSYSDQPCDDTCAGNPDEAATKPPEAATNPTSNIVQQAFIETVGSYESYSSCNTVQSDLCGSDIDAACNMSSDDEADTTPEAEGCTIENETCSSNPADTLNFVSTLWSGLTREMSFFITCKYF